MLAPLTRITDATRMAATGSLSHRIRLEGRRDEFRELADAFDAMLARLEAHVAEQQRFAANASHELRTPLAITQTLLDVARKDPNRDNGELVERLHAVNTRAIDLTEALLLLSRADQRSFAREHVDLSLIAEEATETLLPLAEERGVTIETSGDATPTIGSPALLLQMTTNLVHNAIVHNLPDHGTVWVTTSVHPKSVVLTVENTGEKLTPQLVSTLAEPFQRGSNAYAPTTPASASAWRSSRASPRHTTEPSPSPPGPPAGSASRCSYPPRHWARRGPFRPTSPADPPRPRAGPTEIGRAEHEDLEALRPALVAPPRPGRDAHHVPLPHVDDLVVELHPPAPAHDDVHLLLPLVRVAVGEAVAGRDALIAEPGLLEPQRVARVAELQVGRAVEVGPEILQILLEVPARERHAASLRPGCGRQVRRALPRSAGSSAVRTWGR